MLPGQKKGIWSSWIIQLANSDIVNAASKANFQQVISIISSIIEEIQKGLLMENIIFIIIGFLIILTLLVFLVYRIMQKKNNPDVEQQGINYKTFFILGACFLPAGIAISLSSGEFSYNALSVLGFIYLILGIANKDKWNNKK